MQIFLNKNLVKKRYGNNKIRKNLFMNNTLRMFIWIESRNE